MCVVFVVNSKISSHVCVFCFDLVFFLFWFNLISICSFLVIRKFSHAPKKMLLIHILTICIVSILLFQAMEVTMMVWCLQFGWRVWLTSVEWLNEFALGTTCALPHIPLATATKQYDNKFVKPFNSKCLHCAVDLQLPVGVVAPSSFVAAHGFWVGHYFQRDCPN